MIPENSPWQQSLNLANQIYDRLTGLKERLDKGADPTTLTPAMEAIEALYGKWRLLEQDALPSGKDDELFRQRQETLNRLAALTRQTRELLVSRMALVKEELAQGRRSTACLNSYHSGRSRTGKRLRISR